ncbi:multicopper oxidase domain-containing protein [Kitasatospora sp. RG8]|uniref:multicopper oxidase domain-containing protein n=1 Tax=Kitasatospora sp. RG8 TaxID=2820815 RepID=UPI001FD795C4|nr:multicopper oxidase domain-containing protein [Kitasatospora sp. RG8]
MRFDVSAKPVRDDSALPDRLAAVERLDPGAAVATRTFLFQQSGGDGRTITGLPYRPGRALARPRPGTTEIWRFVTDFHHPVHLHLDHFQVLSRNGGSPGRYDAGWKETVDLRPAEAVELAVRFTDYAGTFTLHCHNPEYEDMAGVRGHGWSTRTWR